MNMKLYYMKATLTILIFLLLTLASAFSSKKQEKSIRNMNNKKMTLYTLKSMSALAVINLMVFMTKDSKILLNLLNWNKDFKMKFKLTMFLDKNFMFFLTTALMVTWSMIEFSMYYMESDPLSKKFFRLLTIFLLNMLILTSSKNLFVFFMGWEGVGFLSFLLMGWWFTRKEAKAAALQAIIYNRMGDTGMMILIAGVLIISKGWKMTKMKFIKKSAPKWQKILLFATLMAAMGKSAQFSLHAWLPAAMEGPTPVSALLHSSTMVVAGVFLLMRVTKFTSNSTFLSTCSMMGALTAMFAATSAFRQHDMKKMIAYSTTSQLGLMVLAMGLGFPKMALFHICTHAFFKAMLFLCSGSIIHSHKKEQDLRKMSKIKSSLPMTSACLTLGSVALMGVPFLSGFFSKDLMLESVMNNPVKILSFLLATSATFLTAAYSFRMVTFCFNKKTKENTSKPMKEENPSLYLPLTRLAMGTMLYGWFLSKWLFKIPPLFPLTIVKSTPLMVTMLGAILAATIMLSMKNKMKMIFFTKTWFFKKISHIVTKTIMSKMALMMSTRTLDRGWNELMGGQGVFLAKKTTSQYSKIAQTGYMKQYLLSMFMISISMLLLTKM